MSTSDFSDLDPANHVFSNAIESLIASLGQGLGSCDALAGREAANKSIQLCERAISRIKEKINSFSPITVLPDEILSRVFSDLVAGDSDVSEDGGEYSSWVQSISGITHTCYRWREIALNNPSMWTYIASQAPDDAIEEYLKRSKGLPLDVAMTYSDDADIERANGEGRWSGSILLEELHRIRHLRITMDTTQFHEYLCHLLSSPAPALQSVALVLRDIHSRWIKSRGTLNVIFHDELPMLRHVSISVPGRRVVQNILEHATLKTLDVHGLGVQMLLSSLPNLKSLTSLRVSRLGDEGKDALGQTFDMDGPPITFNQLNNIEVAGNPVALRSFLNAISFTSIPTLLSLDLEFLSFRSDVSAVRDILITALEKTLGAKQTLEGSVATPLTLITSLDLRLDSKATIYLSNGSKLRFTFTSSEVGWDKILSFNDIGMAIEIASLTIPGQVLEFKHQQSRLIYDITEPLVFLRIERAHAAKVASFLSPRAAHELLDSDTGVACDPKNRFANLDTIHFNRVSFPKSFASAARADEDQGYLKDLDEVYYPVIDEVILLVLKYEIPLKEVIFYKCSGFKDDMYQRVEAMIGRATKAAISISWYT